jgi:hypothetical protein
VEKPRGAFLQLFIRNVLKIKTYKHTAHPASFQAMTSCSCSEDGDITFSETLVSIQGALTPYNIA